MPLVSWHGRALVHAKTDLFADPQGRVNTNNEEICCRLCMRLTFHSFPSSLDSQTFGRDGKIALYLFTGRKVKVELEESTHEAVAVEIQPAPLSRHLSNKPLAYSATNAFRTIHSFDEVHAHAVQQSHHCHHQKASPATERVRPPTAASQPVHIPGIACLPSDIVEQATEQLLDASATAATAATIFGDLNQLPSPPAPSCPFPFPAPFCSPSASTSAAVEDERWRPSAVATQNRESAKGSTNSPSRSQQKQPTSDDQEPPAMVAWSPHSTEKAGLVPVFQEEEMLRIFAECDDR